MGLFQHFDQKPKCLEDKGKHVEGPSLVLLLFGSFDLFTSSD